MLLIGQMLPIGKTLLIGQMLPIGQMLLIGKMLPILPAPGICASPILPAPGICASAHDISSRLEVQLILELKGRKPSTEVVQIFPCPKQVVHPAIP
jgi:hypothetical protein